MTPREIEIQFQELTICGYVLKQSLSAEAVEACESTRKPGGHDDECSYKQFARCDGVRGSCTPLDDVAAAGI